MTKYEVKIEEVRTYFLEVEADTPEEAEELAMNHPDFLNDLIDETDAYVAEVNELED